MSTDSLAVRYRPRRFADVTGQRHAVAVLRAYVRGGVPPQQILLAGGSGLGKTTLARVFTAALFCAARTGDGDACGVCPDCVDVVAGTHPDLIELDAASHGGKDEVREIAQRAALVPARAAWKVYIIDEAHGLTGPGGQAALKLLEDPPAHVIFILATTDPQKLPAALRGRCLISELVAPTRDELLGNLRRVCAGERWVCDDDVLAAVLAASDPLFGVRGTVTTLAKLAPLFAQGRAGDAAQAESLLGVAGVSRLRPLVEAVDAGDRLGALAALDALRRQVADAELRRGLVAWARHGLREALTTGRGDALWVWRLDVLLHAPAGELWSDLVVAKVADPGVDPAADAVAAVTADAERVLAELLAATAQARQLLAGAQRAPAQPPVAQLPVAQPPVAQLPVAQPPVAQPAGRDSGVAVEAFFAALGQLASRRVLALVRSCQVRVDGDRLSVLAGSDALGRLLADPEVAGALRQAASAARLQLAP